MMTEAAILEKIFEKYRFVEPVPEHLRGNLLESRARVLKSVLKEVGDYSIWYALVLFILLKSRKLGVKFSVTVAKAILVTTSVIASAAVISGTYVAIKYFNAGLNSTIIEKKNGESETVNTNINESSNANVEEKKTVTSQDAAPPVYEITLYNGKKYRGVIKSRGLTYVISTSQGEVRIPGNQIRLIKRAK